MKHYRRRRRRLFFGCGITLHNLLAYFNAVCFLLFTNLVQQPSPSRLACVRSADEKKTGEQELVCASENKKPPSSNRNWKGSDNERVESKLKSKNTEETNYGERMCTCEMCVYTLFGTHKKARARAYVSVCVCVFNAYVAQWLYFWWMLWYFSLVFIVST